MSIQVKATFKAADDTKVEPISVRAMVVSVAGKSEKLAQANTDNDGQLDLKSNTQFNQYLPYIYLEYLHKRRWLRLKAIPVKYTRSLLDFGEVTIPATTLTQSSIKPEKTMLARTVSNAEHSEIETLNEERLPVLELQVSQLKNEKSVLSQKVSSLQSQVSNITLERDSAITQKAALESEVLKKNQRVSELQSELEAKSPKDTPINQLFENTGMQLEQAHNKLSSGRKHFSLGKVSMELKVLPGQSGSSVRVADAELINEVGADALSTVKIEFNDDSVSATSAHQDIDNITVPDLSGYTKALAERTIHGLGLISQWQVENIVEADTHSAMNGRIIRQSPVAGTLVNKRTEVVLTLAKAAIMD